VIAQKSRPGEKAANPDEINLQSTCPAAIVVDVRRAA
jgi:hypothetical protein